MSEVSEKLFKEIIFILPKFSGLMNHLDIFSPVFWSPTLLVLTSPAPSFYDTGLTISFFLLKWIATLNLKDHRTSLILIAYLLLSVWFISNWSWSWDNLSLHSSGPRAPFQLKDPLSGRYLWLLLFFLNLVHQ